MVEARAVLHLRADVLVASRTLTSRLDPCLHCERACRMRITQDLEPECGAAALQNCQERTEEDHVCR